MYVRLPHDETDERKRYSMPDVDELHDAYIRLYRAVWYDHEGAPDIEDIKRVLMLANGYVSLTTYELGQECCVGKLRDIWRARRHRGPAEGTDTE
jgi:hypothetical protein